MDARLDAMIQALNQSLDLHEVGALTACFAAELARADDAECTAVDGAERPVIGTYRAVSAPADEDDPHTLPRFDLALLVGGRMIGTIALYGMRDDADLAASPLARLLPHAAIAIENSRLFATATRATRDAAMLARTANALARTDAPADFYAGLAAVAERSLGASGVGVYLADAESERVEATYITGIEESLVLRLREEFWGSAAGAVVRDERARFIDDLSRASVDADGAMAATNAALVADGVHSVALLPLRVEGGVRGVLAIRFAHPRRFDALDQRLYEDFATQVSIALRNARQIEDLERRAARLGAVARVQQAIPRLRRDEVYAEIAHAVASVIDVSAVALLGTASRTGGGTVRPLYVTARGVATVAGPHEPGIPLALLGAVAGAYASGRPEIHHEPRWSWALGGVAGDAPGHARSELAAPIQHGARLLGVLHLQSDRHDGFDAADVELIATIARQAGAAIEMARLFEAQQRERELAEGSADIARAALSNATASTAAAAILDIVHRLVPFAGAAVALVDGDASPDDDPLTPRGDELNGGEIEETLAYVAATGAAGALQGCRVAARESLLPGSIAAGVPMRRTRGGAHAPLEERALPDAMDVTTVALAAKGRLVGLLVVLTAGSSAPPDTGPSGIDDASDDALIRLAAPIALALDTLALSRDERRRRDRERTLATALAALEQPVLLLDPDGRVRDLNSAATRVYATTREGLLGLALDDIVVHGAASGRPIAAGDGVARDVGAAEAVGAIAHPTSGRAPLRATRQEHRRHDGTTFPAESTRAPIRDEAGALVGEVVLVRDLTTEHRIEEHLRQHEKLAALGELVAGVAHELNNPLTGVSAFAQLLLEDELSDEQDEAVRLIKREADRAVGVIRDLLLFSRKTGPQVSSVDVNELVQSTVRLRAYHLRTAGVELTLELDAPLPEVNGDAQKLQQVLVNLLVNAEDAVVRSLVRKITVATSRRDAWIVIAVSDTGYGIAPEVRGHVFEPFFTTKPAGAGTGLGLSVSYGIIESHGGTLSMTSEPGAGATFRITLPIPNPTPSPVPE